MIRWRFAVAGAAAFSLAHAVELYRWDSWFHGAYAPWFLNSGRAAAFTAACLFIVGLFASASEMPETLGRFANVVCGACVAMTIVLLVTGPGTLFPIALALGAIVLACATGLGTLLAAALRFLDRT